MQRCFFLGLAFFLVACAASPANSPTPASTEQLQTPAPFVRIADFPGYVLSGTYYGIVAVLKDDGFWVLTSDLLAYYKSPECWRVIVAAPPGEWMLGMDEQGRVYASGMEGKTISVWQGKTWTIYGKEQGWMPIEAGYFSFRAVYYSPFSDRDGKIWLATAQDVRMFDGASWHIFTAEDMGMQLPVPGETFPNFQLVYDPITNALWVAECDQNGGWPDSAGGAGVRRYLNGVWEGADWPLHSGCAQSMALDNDGALWVGLEHNVWRFDPLRGDWANLGTPRPLEYALFGYPHLIVPDAQGGAWVLEAFPSRSRARPERVYYLQNGHWTLLTDYATGEALWMSARADGSAYLAYNGGLYLLEGGEKKFLTELRIVHGSSIGGHLFFVADTAGKLGIWTDQP